MMRQSFLEIMPASGIAAVSVSRQGESGAPNWADIDPADFVAVVASFATLGGEAGVLALVYGDDDDIAAYATRLIADSADLSGRLTSAVSTARGAEMLSQHKAVLETIQAIPREDFSSEFVEVLADVHADAAALFEAGAACLADPSLATLARDFHPVAASSAREARRLHRRYRTASPSNGRSNAAAG